MEEEIVKLSDEEVEAIKECQKRIEALKATLGNLRIQYLLGEKNIIQGLEQAQTALYGQLNSMSETKGIPTTGEWVFDSSAYVFRKRK